jgi:hypothetical protein
MLKRDRQRRRSSRSTRHDPAAGFALEEIELLFADDAPGRPASRALAEAKLAEIDAQMASLARAGPSSNGECAARVRQLTPARAAFTAHYPPEPAGVGAGCL